MRGSSTALFLSLLLCGCAAETRNEANNNGGATVPAPANGAAPTSDTAPKQQPANETQAPEPAGEVTLSAAPAQTTEDSTVTLTLRNGSEQQVGYNLCTSALETSAGRAVPTNRVCTMELRTLEPGRTATYRYELPVNMLEGSYRFLTQVHWMQSNRTSGIRSNSIEVRPD